MDIARATTAGAVTPTGVTWVDQLLMAFEKSTNGKLTVKVGDVNITAVIEKETVEFFLENKAFLIAMGKECFVDFMTLMQEKKHEEAFTLLLSKMTAEDIILRMELDAQQLASHNAMRDQFYAKLKSFAITVCTGLAAKLVIGLLTGGIPL